MPSNKKTKSGLAYRFDASLVARHLRQGDSSREDSRAQKINHILSVSTSLFAAEGLAGVSMRRVAADAGVTLSTLQHYFGNRQNLVDLTINALLDIYIADFTAISRDTATPARERFENIIDGLLGAVESPLFEAFYAHLWAAAAQDSNILEHIRGEYAGYFEALAGIVGQMRPDWPVERATATAIAIATHIDGLLVARLISPPTMVSWDAVIVGIRKSWLDSILSG